MADYGKNLRFGYFLVPMADQPLVATAQAAERLGLDYVAVQDHPYQRRFVETLSLLAALATATERIGLLPDVINLQLRQPAVLAKAAATIDLLSGGRFELGLGAGAFPEAVAAYGGPGRTGGEALTALDEAIQVIRKVWSGESNLRVDGEHYRLAGAKAGPVPAHSIGIWLGAVGPRALELTARAADGWLPSFRSGESVERKTAQLDAALAGIGRDPAEVRRILNVGVVDDLPAGPIDLLADLAVDLGFDTFIFGGEPDGLPRLANEIAPAVRDAVASRRA
ncbi:MAG: LLM class flavin-dependent oxidoreductase [Acidimicrobiia bacterium]|nr:LLM class flavin-dependent oxidoreductase [Acidimicrobiia bacterium]